MLPLDVEKVVLVKLFVALAALEKIHSKLSDRMLLVNIESFDVTIEIPKFVLPIILFESNLLPLPVTPDIWIPELPNKLFTDRTGQCILWTGRYECQP